MGWSTNIIFDAYKRERKKYMMQYDYVSVRTKVEKRKGKNE
jgi:hypothetical protein